MTLQQLRCILEVVQQQLNITAAARALNTCQSGVSRHIRTLEDELGVRIFGRSGPSLTHLTPEGHAVIELARISVNAADRIRSISADLRDPASGTLVIGTTHTQARYMLPAIISRFMARFPKVKLSLHQGSPQQVAAMAGQGEVDLVISSEAVEKCDELITLPAYSWDHCVLVRRDHPLAQERTLTLEAVAVYPIVTYTRGFTGRAHLDDAFARKGLAPNIVFTASDADVIKTYVSGGIGIGIIAAMAFNPATDGEFTAKDASHLFPPSVTHIGLRRDSFLRRYAYDFIELCAPHLRPERIAHALELCTQAEVDASFAPLPHFQLRSEGLDMEAAG